MPDDFISLPDAPPISGLKFRHFRGESDYPQMVAAIAASADADQVERATTLEDVANTYNHLTNSDPYQDMIFAEINGQVIGYSRGWWFIEGEDGPYLYAIVGFLVPDFRRKGIGQLMVGWMEDRLRAISAGHPPERSKFYQVFVSDSETGLVNLLEKKGYQAIRYFYEMVRPSLDDIPDFPLPAGLEVRPVLPEHYRLLWDAADEAFRDHWGYAHLTEEDYQAWLNNSREFQPHLFQVAWDIESNQVAGQVQTFIDHLENEKYQRKRGYTEGISVRRTWRRRGLARALIARSLQVQKEAGMTESALGVDSENLSGATRIYEECGFRVVKRSAAYRKEL